MALKRVYSCDICRECIESRAMFGLNFSNNISFTLGDYRCTEGIHICYRCARQLKGHLNSSEITKILDVVVGEHEIEG